MTEFSTRSLPLADVCFCDNECPSYSRRDSSLAIVSLDRFPRQMSRISYWVALNVFSRSNLYLLTAEAGRAPFLLLG